MGITIERYCKMKLLFILVLLFVFYSSTGQVTVDIEVPYFNNCQIFNNCYTCADTEATPNYDLTDYFLSVIPDSLTERPVLGSVMAHVNIDSTGQACTWILTQN